MNRISTVKLIALTCLGVLLAGACYIYYTFNPAQPGTVFLQCPVRSLFNLYCPGCGSQRAVHYLLHGQIGTAFQYNPLMVVFLPLTFLLALQLLLRWGFGIYLKIGLAYNNYFVWSFLVLYIVFFIVRNLPVAQHIPFMIPPQG